MRSSGADPERWLNDIRDNIRLAERFTRGVVYEAFRDDDLRFYAVTRCLEIISEASRRLPQEVKDRHTDIPWIEMAAAGNIYRHEYEDVERQLVWTAVRKRLPALLAVVEGELRRAAPEP
jgi:uncharacterized protein with HEPN domain